MSKFLHIVSFEVPYPANYGGAIDVFYKIKALKELGLKIYLHAFENRNIKNAYLEKFCEKIFYYERKKSGLTALSILPYIVRTRTDKNLIRNLKNHPAPILFEGLHSTYPLFRYKFNDRKVLVRMHNVEHNYYQGLAKSETNWFQKWFFKGEALKLKFYERVLKRADILLSISRSDQIYFAEKFKDRSVLIPPFHSNSKVKSHSKKGYFALYHGDLKVVDNQNAVEYLVNIFNSIDYPLVIAGDLNYSPIEAKACQNKKISFIQLESDEQLAELLKRAHINILPTFQNTGIKLKLINALYNSRFCLVHENMVLNTGLESLCVIAKKKSDFIKQMYRLMEEEYTEEDTELREKVLQEYDCMENAKKILALIN